MKRITMRTARLFANMTEAEACAAMKIKPQQLKSWENGNSVPSMEHALTMSETYGLSLDVISFNKADNKGMFNGEALRMKILEDFGTEEAFCKAVQMKQKTLRSRLAGESYFLVSEIVRIRAALRLTDEETDNCFFTLKADDSLKVAMKLIEDLNDAEFDILRTVLCNSRKPSALAQI